MNISELDAAIRRHNPLEKQALNKKSVTDNGYISYHSNNQITERLRKEAMEETEHKNILLSYEKINFIKHARFINGIEHKHPFIELVYVYSGQCMQWINNDYVILEAGDICLLDSNVIQKIEYCGEDDIIINCIMWKSYFDHSFFASLDKNNLLTSFFTRALYNQKENSHYIIFRTSGNQRIRRLLQEAICEYFNKGLFYEKNVECFMSLIFNEMLRTYRQDITDKFLHLFHHNQIIHILLYIQENCQTVTLKEIAQIFHFNPSYLSRFLKKMNGVSFNSLVQEARLNKACRLLTHTLIPVEEIVNEVGYSNINYFYRIFKEAYQLTPAEYRRESNPSVRLEL